MMRDTRERRSFVFADLESARQVLEDAHKTFDALGLALAGMARTQGRLVSGLAYGAVDPDSVRNLRKAGIDTRVTAEDGDGSAPESIALTLDVGALLTQGTLTDTCVILVTDDAQMAEVSRRLRRAGAWTVLVVPAALSTEEPTRSADRAFTLEAVLNGETPHSEDAPVRTAPPAAEQIAAVAGPAMVVSSTAAVARPSSAATDDRYPRLAVSPPVDLGRYDWSRLVHLMLELEAKMPFVGIRWLKNKVLGPHNVGVYSVVDKQLLLNRAVDMGLIETYRVGNRDEHADPVTACRLVRSHALVQGIASAPASAPPDVVYVDFDPDEEGGAVETTVIDAPKLEIPAEAIADKA